MVKETKMRINPYVYPGLKINGKEKRELLSNSLYGYYKLTKDDLLTIIAEEASVPKSLILQRTRKREIVNARFIFCAILKEHFGYTLERIGSEIDGRDHTSIRHAIAEYRNRMYTEELFKGIVHRIYDRIGIKKF